MELWEERMKGWKEREGKGGMITVVSPLFRRAPGLTLRNKMREGREPWV